MLDETIKDEALIQNLTDAGFSAEQIEQFLSCHRRNQQVAQMRILNEYRGKVLDTVQNNQEKLYCLDYLIRMLKNNK